MNLSQKPVRVKPSLPPLGALPWGGAVALRTAYQPAPKSGSSVPDDNLFRACALMFSLAL